MTQIPVAGLNAELALGTAKLSAGVADAMGILGRAEGAMAKTGRRARQAGDDIDRGLNRGMKGAGGSAAVFERRLDSLANRFNPLMAASMRYERELKDLDDALKKGIVNQALYEQNLERLNAELASGASGFGRATQQAQAFNATAGTMSHQTGNIAAQFQDIGVQLAGGQSPFLIALQQGTQLNGVFTQMGGGVRGVAKGLGSALLSLVSPLSLITIGAIAAGGALVQWAMSAGKASEETERLNEAAERQKQITDSLTQAVQQLRLQREMMASGLATEDEQRAANELRRLAAERVILERELADLHAQANENLGVINTTELERLNAAIALNEQNRATNQSLLEATQRERARLDAAQDAKAQAEEMRRIMALVGSMNISNPWTEAQAAARAAATEAERYASAMARVEGVRRDQTRRGGVVFDPRDPRYDPVAAEAARIALDPNRGRTLADLAPVRVGGGGGGGRGVDALAQEVERLNSAVSRGVTPMAQYNDGLSKLDALKAKGLSDAAYSQEVARLNEELASSNPLVNDLSDAFGNFVSSGFKDFDGFAKSIGNIFRKLIADLVSQAAQRLIFNVGFNVSASGGGGNILGSLLGGGGGGAGGIGSIASIVGGIGKFAGGIGTGLSGVLSGGGIMSGISGGLAAGGAAGMGAALGAALPVLGPLAIVGGLLGRRRRRRRAAAAAAAAAEQARLAEEQATAQEAAQLQARIDQLTLTSAELRQRELDALRPANRELQERIWKLEDEKRISQERSGLETQLLQLQGDTAELRRRELEALDPSNRALQENIWRLEDAAAATDKLNEALGKLSAEDFATALDFNRARGALASGAIYADSPSAAVAALAQATQSMPQTQAQIERHDALLTNMNNNLALLWKTVQRFDLDGMPPVRA